MHRPTPKPDLTQQRLAARKTARFVALLAVLIFIAFMVFVWVNNHG